MLSMCIVHFAIWCFVQAVTESCRRGDMIASTDSVVLPGSNITFSCQLKQGEQCTELIFNNSEKVLAYGKHTFTCKCKSNGKLICGIDICVGNPPDQPKNVSCIQHGRDGHLTCTWDKGRLTHINTTYIVQVTSETESLSFAEENGENCKCGSLKLTKLNFESVESFTEEKEENCKYGSLTLTKLNFESNYTAVVAASNRLGNASSEPFTFMLIDIVKPHSPTDILVKFHNFSATDCTVIWHDQQQNQRFRLRYRPVNSHSWNMVETLNATRYNLHNLKPYTEYEFQVCCKFHPSRGLWSNWSDTFRIQTPEAVPTGLLDVWYLKKDIDSQTQNITLFWKAVSKSEARGKILHYTLTFQSLTQKSPRTDVSYTTQTHYIRVLPKMDYNITVCAHNAKGNSSLTSIITNLSILDLPPPQNISVTPIGNNSICVIWDPPIKSTAFIDGYIVEWAGTHSPEPHLNWIKCPASSSSTIISAPSAGPQPYTAVKGDGIWVSWDEIPGHQQMGCITNYTIYLQKKTSEMGPEVYVIPKETSRNSFLIKNLQRDVNYGLWMTASTMAGESPKGNEELVYIESSSEWIIILAACIFFSISTFICLLQSPQKVLSSFLSVLVPQWYKKAIPDPANSTWAKKYSSVEDELNLHSDQCLSYLSSFEEPETIEVEVVFIKREPEAFSDISIISNIKSSENQDRSATENSCEKQESTEQDSEYKPLVPSTPDDGDNYKCHLPDLYKKVGPEEAEPVQMVSEYLANPLTDITANYLPSKISSAILDVNEECNEFECKSFSIFPTTSLLMPMFSCGGKLTLDAVKIDCNSFTE